MASSLFVNALQVEFQSVLAMKHTEISLMFKSLVDTGFEGFFAATGSVYEDVVVEFFVNAKVIAKTIVSFVAIRKLILKKDIFAESFGLPTEGMTRFLDFPKKKVDEMRIRFSASAVPFRASSKKREMKIEYRLLHDIVSKALCAKAISFDMVTSEKLNFMIAITAWVRVNWAQVLFHVLLGMVDNPRRQSQGYAIQISIIPENLIKADLGGSFKLHSQNILNEKSVMTYIKKNMKVTPAGETSKTSGDATSEIEGGKSKAIKTVGMPKRKPAVENRKAEKPGTEKKKQAESMKEADTLPTVEDGGLTAPTMSNSETSSDKDSFLLVTRRRKRPQVEESSDSEDTTSAPSMAITNKGRTMSTNTAQPSIDNRMEPQSRLDSSNQMDDEDLFTSEIPEGTLAPIVDIEDRVDNDPFIMAEPMVRSEENPGCETQMDHVGRNAAISDDAQGVRVDAQLANLWRIDSDLVIYRTTLVRTYQVVTICRVDKSEVLVVLISPHDSKPVPAIEVRRSANVDQLRSQSSSYDAHYSTRHPVQLTPQQLSLGAQITHPTLSSQHSAHWVNTLRWSTQLMTVNSAHDSQLSSRRSTQLMTAPGSDQFHEGIGTSMDERLDRYLIWSTTRISTPSPVCTRKPTKLSRTESPLRDDRIGYPRTRASENPRQRSIDSYMHRDLTQPRHLMTPTESNGDLPADAPPSPAGLPKDPAKANTDPSSPKTGKINEVKPQFNDSADHHRIVVFRHDDSAGHHINIHVGPFRHDGSASRSLRVKEFSSQEDQAQYLPQLYRALSSSKSKLRSVRNHLPKAAQERKNHWTTIAKISNSATTSRSLNSSIQVSKVVSIESPKEYELTPPILLQTPA
ncbi:hypothetical protein F511_27598 [Dorcoceras hygrometricum]|uniref:Uncharacterized protein n=1 Tax=Dorcoceras hygrometricum TaxID=472368 RepID=A0A2Z7BZX7_9LAMI|nr:hypothetical protein F511_27598 [Dorcoceras hygrometricum]